MWAVDGTWRRVFTALMAQSDADDDLGWAVSVDSTIMRAHQHAAEPVKTRKKGPRLTNHTIVAERNTWTANSRHRPCEGYQLDGEYRGDVVHPRTVIAPTEGLLTRPVLACRPL